MGIFSRIFGKSKGMHERSDQTTAQKPDFEKKGTGTVLSSPAPAVPADELQHPEQPAGRAETPARPAVTVEKPVPVNRVDQATRSLPTWSPGDEILGRYKVEGVFAGGMGQVYIAEHKGWRRKVAIKQPNAELLNDEINFPRILREAEAWTELGLHPNIAYCYFVMKIEEVPHIVIEYVDGGNLETWIADGKCLDYKTNLDLAIQFCHGLEHAHKQGKIHRDIKPANVLMTNDGTLKITDFGLVSGGDGQVIEVSGNQEKRSDSKLTSYGAFMGTLGYMAPEQAVSAGEVDHRADIFSFGVCLYEMFCGARPYNITWGDRQEPPDPAKVSFDENFPPRLAAVLKKCVQWDREDRYGSVEEIRREIAAIYREKNGEDSPYTELPEIDLAPDNLNNKGVSLQELGRQEDAKACFRLALELDKVHPQATYNLGLMEWRAANGSPLALIEQLENIQGNTNNAEKVKIFIAKAYLEQLMPSKAYDVLKESPELFQMLFGNGPFHEVKMISELEGWGMNCFSTFSLSHDGELVLAHGVSKTFSLWNLRNGNLIDEFEGHTGWINSVCFSPTGDHALSGGADKTIRYWDLDSGSCQFILRNSNEVKFVLISPDGKYAVAGFEEGHFASLGLGPQGDLLCLWDLESQSRIGDFSGHEKAITCICISPDGQYLLSSSFDDTIRLWDMKTRFCLKIYEGYSGIVKAIAITPDNRYALSGSSDGTLVLWDIERGDCTAVIKGHTEEICSVCISPNGKFALSAATTRKNSFCLWRLESLTCLSVVAGQDWAAQSVCFSPDGNFAVIGCSDSTLRIWDIKSVHSDDLFLGSFEICHPKNYFDLCNEKDEFIKIITKTDLQLRNGRLKEGFRELFLFWKIKSYSSIPEIEERYWQFFQKGKIKSLVMAYECGRLEGHTEPVNSLSISKDGQTILSGSRDKTIRLWNFRSCECLAILEGNPLGVKAVCFLPDGRTALSGSDKNLQIWDIESRKCVGVLEGHKHNISFISVHPEGRFAISGASWNIWPGGEQDTTLRMWDLEKMKCIGEMNSSYENRATAKISSDGKYAITSEYGLMDCTLQVWNLNSLSQQSPFSGEVKSPIKTMDISSNNRFLLSGGTGKNDSLCLWDLRTFSLLKVLDNVGQARSVCISPDCRFAVSDSDGTFLRIWDLYSGSCLKVLKGHEKSILSVCFDTSGNYLISSSGDNTVRIWRLIWDLEFPDPVDWDEAVRPYLNIFLTLRNGQWTDDDFQALTKELAEKRGLGWVRPEGVRKELEKMTGDWLK